jgi:hypothetical protein
MVFVKGLAFRCPEYCILEDLLTLEHSLDKFCYRMGLDQEMFVGMFYATSANGGLFKQFIEFWDNQPWDRISKAEGYRITCEPSRRPLG